MKSYTSGKSSRGRGRSRRRAGNGQGRRYSDAKVAPQKKGFWSRIADFFAPPDKGAVKTGQRNGSQPRSQARTPRKPEPVEVTSTGSDRKSTRLNSSHAHNSYAVFRLKKKT